MGLKACDILLAAVAVPVVGAMVIGLYPSNCKVVNKGVAWCYRCFAIGIGLSLYGGQVGMIGLCSMDAMVPIVGIGLGLAAVSMLVGVFFITKAQPSKQEE